MVEESTEAHTSPVAAVHIAEVGVRGAVGAWRGSRRVEAPGLRQLDTAFCAPLSRGPFGPQFRRWVCFSVWDDRASVQRFEAEHSFAGLFGGGWSVHLAPIRMHGSWPGLDDEVPAHPVEPHDGRTIVVTVARPRLRQLPRFFRWSMPAARVADEAPGMVWGTGASRPPGFVISVSIWESVGALTGYAYGRDPSAHRDAVAAGRRKPFHRQEAFIRFRPIHESGGLDRTSLVAPAPAVAA